MSNRKQKEMTEFLLKILIAMGIPANWTKLLAGALAGAAIAIYTLTLSSCGFSLTASMDGDKYQVSLSQERVITSDSLEIFVEVEEVK